MNTYFIPFYILYQQNNNLESLQQQLALRENEIAILRAERDTAQMDLLNTRRDNSALQASLEDLTLRHANEVASLREALYQTRVASKNTLRSLEKKYSKQLREMRDVLRAAHAATEKATEELLLIHKNKAVYAPLARPQKDHALSLRNDHSKSLTLRRACLSNDDDSSGSDWNYSDHAFLVMKQKQDRIRRAQREAKSPFVSRTSRKFGEQKHEENGQLPLYTLQNRSEMSLSSALGTDSEEELTMHKATKIEALINTHLNSLSSNLSAGTGDKKAPEKQKDHDFLHFAKGIKATGKSPSLNRSCRTKSFHPAPTYSSSSPTSDGNVVLPSHSVPFRLPLDDDDNEIYFEKMSHPTSDSSTSFFSRHHKSLLDDAKFEHGNSFDNISSSGLQNHSTRPSGTTLSFESVNLTPSGRHHYFSEIQQQDQSSKTELVGMLLSSISVSGDLLALKDEKTLDLSNGSGISLARSKKDRRRRQTHGKVYATPNAKPKASRLFDAAALGSTDDSLTIVDTSPTRDLNEKKNSSYSSSSSDIDAHVDTREKKTKISLKSLQALPSRLDESIESNFDDFSVGASLFANPGRSPTTLRRRKVQSIPLSYSPQKNDIKASLSGFEYNSHSLQDQDSSKVLSQASVVVFPAKNNYGENIRASQSNVESAENMENMENSQSDAANVAFDFGTDSEPNNFDDDAVVHQDTSEFVLAADEEVSSAPITHSGGLDEAFDFGTETESEVESEAQIPHLSESFRRERSSQESADDSQNEESKPNQQVCEENNLFAPGAYNFCLSVEDFDDNSNDNIENK